jgi:DNA-binding LacI/PurR family transcriptional regulator
MANVSKYAQVMSVIERRVREGDYLLRSIPGERRIAEETGVSYMTARRAVIELLKKKVLIRHADGSLDAHPGYGNQSVRSRVVLLYPAYPSPYLAHLRQVVASALERHKLTLRPVLYVHWDDPVIADALDSTGGALVIPSTETPPPRVVAAMRENKVVMLDGDFTGEGIPSIQLFPDDHLERVFAHVAALGHRQIDCVNTQQHNPEIDRRIALWHKWLATYHCTGRLWDNPAPAFADPTPFAREILGGAVDRQEVNATALVCTTFPAALGALRAFWERGRRVGRDISICSMNIEHPGRYCCPSVTGLDMPDLFSVLAKCFAWFCGDDSWNGRLLLEPAEPVFFAGESSAPAAGAR